MNKKFLGKKFIYEEKFLKTTWTKIKNFMDNYQKNTLQSQEEKDSVLKDRPLTH